MKANTICICGIILFGLLSLFGCRSLLDGSSDPNYRQLLLYANYDYSVSSVKPSLVLLKDSTSRGVHIPSLNGIASVSPQRVYLSFSSVRFFDALGVYQIQDVNTDVTTEELRNGSWIVDHEDALHVSRARKLDFVLVLDASSSLRENAPRVLSYANASIDSVQHYNDSSRVGIVGFAGEIYALPLTSNFSLAHDFIDGLRGDSATRLYEAINTGIEMLRPSVADGRVIVTFTDGVNNAWSDVSKFETPDFIINQLKQSVQTSSMISSYAIGLRGDGIDEKALKSISQNGGVALFANDDIELGRIFEKCANSVSALYTLTYNRNDSRTSSPIRLKFRINTILY